MYHYRKLPTEEAQIRYDMHEDGFINQSKSMVTEMIDHVHSRLPEGAGGALGAGIAILAAPAVIGGSIALGEAALLGMVGYCIGKKISNWVTDTARKSVYDQFNSDVE